MKLLRKSVSILLSVVMIVSIFTIIPTVKTAKAAQTDNEQEGMLAYPGFYNLNMHWDKEWMSYLPDSTKLNELSIPGIHDACAVDMDYSTWLAHFTQTQDYYYLEQAGNGVRYFDLRIGKEDGKLTMCHGSVYLNGMGGERLRLEEVISGLLRWLSFHESETMILQIKCDKDDCDQEIYKFFQDLLSEQPDKIYCGDHAPTLGEARGKLVILSRLKLTKYEDDLYKEAPYQPNYLLENGTYWALDVSRFEGGDETNKSMAKTTDFGTVEVWTEDVYNIKPSGKWDYVKGSLTGDYNAVFRKNDARSRDKDAWSIIYTSLSYQDSAALIASFATAIAIGFSTAGPLGALASAGITYLIEDDNDMVWPDDGADEINPKLKELLKNNPDLYTGCLETDFMDVELSRRIYSTNFVRINQDPWNQTYRVTFDSNGGSSVEPQDVLPGGYASAPETPSREGYNFSGWYTTPEADRKDFWYFNSDTVNKDITLYAKWDDRSIPYVDASGNSMPAEEAEGIFDQNLQGTFTLSDDGSTGGWYAAQNDFGGEGTGLVIDGNVNLILCDGVTLKLYNGIKVPEGSSLTIWAQSTDALTRGSLEVIKDDADAAVGTSLTEECGSVTFNGGTIKATGNAGAAAIGGLGADVTINGGSVRAESSNTGYMHLPAIGGSGGSVMITGGVVTAYADKYAPAIGSVDNKSTKVAISGGRVSAYGGYIDSPAIGAGSIAAAHSVAEADVTISGGIVNATTRHYGGENNGWAIGGWSGTVRITGGTVTANSSGLAVPYAGIGGKNCTVDLSWTSTDDSVTSCSYDGNIVLHEDKPFRFDDGSDAVSAQDILTSQNKTIVPKAAVGTLTKTEALAPTCVSSGYKAYWTDEEGSLFADEEGTKRIEEPEVIPALGHDWGDPVYAWEDDCDDPDIETHHYMCSAIRTCKRDDAHTQARHVIASETIEAEANCTLPGTKVLTAVFNTDWAEDQTKQIEIPATGHDWGEWTVTKEATPTEEGEETRVCKNDPSHTETRAIPKVDENATFTITFSDEDGATLQTSNVKYGEAPVFSGTLPEKDGYTFDGWTDGENTYANDELPVVKNAASYTAVFSRYVALVEPTIDENGAYILGHVAYYEKGGKEYAVNDEGEIGEELASIELSYFDFKPIDNDTAYQINYYTGPTANLETLVIPKTYDGKPITVLGNDDITETNNSKLFKTGNANLHPFTIELNENITEIKPYTFWAIWVTKVTGDTSNLSTIGKYAFSWANSTGGYALDIRLDHEGTIKCGAGIFNNMNVTARIKHSTSFDRSSFSQKSITYQFTDAHIYSDPVWTWADDYSTATAAFTCTESRCKHEEAVEATVTIESAGGIITYTATAETYGETYTDVKTAYSDGIGAHLVGHSISLDGDIAVNFYMELDGSIKNSKTAYMHFTIPNTSKEYQEQNVLVSEAEKKGDYYIFKCRVAAKDMNSVITAQILGVDKESAAYTYSVSEYANWLLEHKDDSEAYTKAAPLVEKMLQYGAYAKEYFGKTDSLNNIGEVSIPEKFASYTSNLSDELFSGATLSLKSQTTLSLYFSSGETLTFSCVDKDENERVVDTAKNGSYQVARIRNIAAKELQDSFTLTVKSGETVLGTITYSPMNYCYKALHGGTTDGKLKNTVKALYQYSYEANEYFK